MRDSFVVIAMYCSDYDQLATADGDAAAGLHAVALLGVKRDDSVRLGFHTQFWPLQVLLWAVLVFVSFLMPNSVFSAYGQVAKASTTRLIAGL